MSWNPTHISSAFMRRKWFTTTWEYVLCPQPWSSAPTSSLWAARERAFKERQIIYSFNICFIVFQQCVSMHAACLCKSSCCFLHAIQWFSWTWPGRVQFWLYSFYTPIFSLEPVQVPETSTVPETDSDTQRDWLAIARITYVDIMIWERSCRNANLVRIILLIADLFINSFSMQEVEHAT